MAKYDRVNLMGLGSSGRPVGLSSAWGAMLGAGIGNAATIATDELSPSLAPHAELVGLAAAGVASGAMIAMPKTRHAGWVGLAVALLTHVPRYLQARMSSKKAVQQAVDAAVAQANGTQALRLSPTMALNALRLSPTQALNALRLSPTRALQGGLGQPRLLSSPQQATLLANAGSMFRPTLLGGGRR